jgi:hypothetical protein
MCDMGIMAFLMIMVILPAPVLACSCGETTICDLIQAPTIFIGEVIDGEIAFLRQNPWDLSGHQVRLKVLEHFRWLSKTQQTVDINILHIPGMYAPNPYHLKKISCSKIAA